ncbi:serine hydrolase domain-containing protein [Phytomonospora endophytica]|uniref:CubicO group peptidase (Beta-lactamase class C family) n=1 Tax=Phytomonospora endophytica TaxID=714109 RepID=A0A841FB18_9ACTN|nr:serine hydrolase domain-containing protein [Phytomonospora endophytica]MBB6032964.1 CubicO group peptidase (beta-lactamase class C family) [Phytomonospora endophytica]
MDSPDAVIARLAAAPLAHTEQLIVLRDGEVLAEHSFHGGDPDEPAAVKSVTKSVLATVALLAVADGVLDLDDTLGRLLGSRVPGHRRDVTVRHLLTMTGGSEPALDLRGLEPANWLDHLLALPRIAPPGTVFAYDNAAVHVLAGALRTVVGDIDAFAAERILAPAGITRWNWPRDPEGVNWGGAGLELSAKSLAALGELWRTDRLGLGTLLSEATGERVRPGGGDPRGFGYLFWVDVYAASPVFLASGFGGQKVCVARDLGVTVVLTGDVERLSPDGGDNGDVLPGLVAWAAKR